MTGSPINLHLLTEVLNVPTCSYHEHLIIAWLLDYFQQQAIPAWRDEMGNVYATKGQPVDDAFYPVVMAHLDTVHTLAPLVVRQQDDALTAWNPNNLQQQMGIGGDDKAGLFICLEMFKRLPALKGAFFVCEEVGCLGSKGCDKSFFKDAGYALMFDAPCDNILSYTCDGVQLFPDSGPFSDLALPLLTEHRVFLWQRHPYTDAATVKRFTNIAVMNLPAGYFNLHTSQEYVSIKAVQNSADLGERLLNALGTKRYHFAANEDLLRSRPARRVTGLSVHPHPQ